eukprot:GFUD01025040.1.p1 GENE.GFUD01025040.1~~GFUD01025040.1.p1  ORF type:complete len:925 (+),score=337.10 GFUD01025040.1:29-2803(+)
MRKSGAPSKRPFNGLLPFTPPTITPLPPATITPASIPPISLPPSTLLQRTPTAVPKTCLSLQTPPSEPPKLPSPTLYTAPLSTLHTAPPSTLYTAPTSTFKQRQSPQLPQLVTPAPPIPQARHSMFSLHRKPLSPHNGPTSLPTSQSTTVFRYLACVWAKKSTRKHKKWEGDALLKVGTRSVVLIDMEGKEIGRSSGYKMTELSDLEDGGMLGVGGKEVEVTGEADATTWDKMVKQATSAQVFTKKNKKKEEVEEPPLVPDNIPAAKTSLTAGKFKAFKIPGRLNSTYDQFTPERKVQPGVSMFDPGRADGLVMPRPPAGHVLHMDVRLVDVVVDPFISKNLRPHQRAGVLFLYSNLMGFKKVVVEDKDMIVQGAILGDEMGLGKTLQTVALIWTLLKQSPVAGSVLAKKVLIVAPSSLLKNWEAEFRKWLGSERITIHIADSGDKVANFRSYNSAPILVMSYEMLVRTLAEVQKISWDLVVCDEAHRMKNSMIKTSCSLGQLSCKRKLLLTGTPVQNDLGEYFSLVDAACPGLLGTRAKFRLVEAMVELGRQPEASQEQQEEGRLAMEQLGESTRQIILRRTSDVINKYLPPKTVNVVFCRPSPYQARVYTSMVERLLDRVVNHPGQHLAAISSMKKICNAPCLVEDVPSLANGGPNTWEEQAGKLATVTCLLLQLVNSTQEKMVLVSLSTSTLDLLASLCDKYNISTCRLDGSTPPHTRQSMVDRFNNIQSDTRVFLLSSKAGGTGLNLIGASRLVLYDIDWNPATDLQAMARVWRDGQKKHCHVYRLLTTGTIEEKIFQRQMRKRGLDTVGQQATPSHFSTEELRDLFTFRDDTECETHDLLQCECEGSGVVEREEVEQGEVRSCQLGRVVVEQSKRVEELMGWRHYTAPVEDRLEDSLLGVASQFVSFLLRRTQDSGTVV